MQCFSVGEKLVDTEEQQIILEKIESILNLVFSNVFCPMPSRSYLDVIGPYNLYINLRAVCRYNPSQTYYEVWCHIIHEPIQRSNFGLASLIINFLMDEHWLPLSMSLTGSLFNDMTQNYQDGH